MAGVCRPAAIDKLVRTLKQEIGIPIHFHTHDTSGIAAASVLSAVAAGVDAVDLSMDAVSGLTSQPNLGSVVDALRGDPRDPGLDRAAIREISRYWELVREYYAAFESDIRSGTADVYRHAMPGGQYTNLREQARGLGVGHRWPEVAARYTEVNELFGDIIKVTPTSKVVGDMAIAMVTSGLTAEEVLDPDKDIAFPESVVSLFRGEIGQPLGGFPKALQKKILNGAEPLTERPGALMAPVDFDAEREQVEKRIERKVSDRELTTYVLYPSVFEEFAKHRRSYGDVSVLPTPIFFYGLKPHEEVEVSLERGKTLIVRLLGTGDVDERGLRRVFFELNGQPRTVEVTDRSAAQIVKSHPKAEPDNPSHIAAPMPGRIVSIAVSTGQKVERGDSLLSIEAMKMETLLRADRAGKIKSIPASVGMTVDAHDLLIELE
jgi:pyruvate carboxylase